MTVLIPQLVASEGVRYLEERGHVVHVGSLDGLEDASALLVRKTVVDGALLAAAPRLKVVAKHGIGTDNINVDAATARGVWVVNAPLSNADTVAEHTLGLMIALARNFRQNDAAVRRGDYARIRDRLLGVDLSGKTLGLVGLGRIGRAVAKKAALGLDMSVIGHDPHIAPTVLPPFIEPVGRDDVFARADFVCLHVPLSPETHHSIGTRELTLMKPTAFLLNVARGGVLDETALLAALQNGTLAGAGLDVFADEPPSSDNPLFAFSNVLVTAHCAALTREATVRMAVDAARGIDEVLSGRTPTWPVNRPKGT